ncbi:MAG TPA: hypothetical protein VN408_31975 [Actinoplanes sp.]|nr:hypothetical protein [Actinoplanes sp.]
MRLFNSPAPRWAIVAVALWTIAPVLVIFGGWPGLIGGVLVGGYGSHLLHKRKQSASAPVASSTAAPAVAPSPAAATSPAV